MTDYSQLPDTVTEHFSTQWRSPSNIALVKYWGKHGRQLPLNPSISLTLDQAYSDLKLQAIPKGDSDPSISVQCYFEGKINDGFADRIARFLDDVREDLPWIDRFDYLIDSQNSFPHSAGIASSASSMSALCMALCELEKEVFDIEVDTEQLMQKASHLSRLASGSACRSVYPLAAIWGAQADLEDSSDLHAIPWGEQIDPIFHTYKDAILLASSETKSVSSSAGHALMDGNPYATARFEQARRHMSELTRAMQTADLDSFIEIVESEALSLHALMMTSTPSYLLMRPASLAMIERIRAYRAETGSSLCFTLDAGPNIHLLYPASESTLIEAFIESELTPFCEDGKWIADQVGTGPIRISDEV